jgi:hypothetical protein
MDPGELAEHVPRDALVYAEAVARPGEDLSDALQKSVEAVGAKRGDLDEVGPDLLKEIVHEALELPAEDVDYEDDVKSWLGRRAAGFVALPPGALPLAEARGRGGPLPANTFRAAAVLAVSDEDEAREALERILPGQDTSEDEGGADLHYEDEGVAIALAGDRLFVGNPAGVEAALETEADDALRGRDWFRAGLDTVDERASLGFALIETRQFYRLSLAVEGGKQGQALTHAGLLRRSGLDADVPTGLELLATDRGPAVEISYGLTRRPRLRQARALVERLPADSWAAFGDPVLVPLYLDSFAVGVEVGIEEEAGRQLSRRRLRRVVINALGYDVLAALDSLRGPGALYARGRHAADAAGGLVIAGARSSDPAAQPIDAARFVIASFLPRGGVPFGRPPGAPEPRLSTDIPRLPTPLSAIQRDGSLEVFLGSDPATARRREAIGDTDRLARVANRLGEAWEPLGDLDVARLVRFVEGVTGDETDPPGALSKATVDVGGRFEDGIFTLRFQLSAPED